MLIIVYGDFIKLEAIFKSSNLLSSTDNGTRIINCLNRDINSNWDEQKLPPTAAAVVSAGHIVISRMAIHIYFSLLKYYLKFSIAKKEQQPRNGLCHRTVIYLNLGAAEEVVKEQPPPPTKRTIRMALCVLVCWTMKMIVFCLFCCCCCCGVIGSRFIVVARRSIWWGSGTN